ncbi:unnamed protein product [Mytilus coruscus]|uniref:XK-related protein n=1 Tax=Mytilus coruscus TaxID=42192 RepID=A0A6J8E5U2_MYTCO|nr:unnamed protein product [Mytilus coruscus]
MTEMTTQFGWDSNITPWHRNCNKTSASLMKSASTTPLWNFETTSGVYYHDDTLNPMSGIFKILIMVTAILGMVMVVILYAAGYRMCCSGKEKYHDSYARVLANGKSDINSDLVVYLSSYLTLVEATLESAPQLTIQINLLITDMHTDTTYSRILRYFSITTSFLGLAWSLNAFKHQHRKKEQEEDDSMLVKLVHWISRFAEILPRIILIALIAAEYSMIAMYFILYRLLVGVIYGACERWNDDEKFRVLEEPDLFLGMIGNIFCFCVSDVYKCHKKDQCGGKCFAWYYIVYYAENGLLLYLWYSDDQALLDLKGGVTCSKHEWYAPYIFVVVILGFILQPSFLFLYYRLRRTQHEPKSEKKPKKSYHKTTSPDISTISSDHCIGERYQEQSLQRHQNMLNDSTKRQQWESKIDQHLDNQENRQQSLDYDNAQLINNYHVEDGRSNFSQLQKYERSHQTNEQYPVERQHYYQDRQQPLDNDNSQLGNNYNVRYGRANISHLQKYERSHQTDEQYPVERQNNYQDRQQPLDKDNSQLSNNFDFRNGRPNYSHLQRFERYSGERQTNNQDRQQPIENNCQLGNNYDFRDGRSNNSQVERYKRSNPTDERYSAEPQKNNQYRNLALDHDNGHNNDLRDRRPNNSQLQRYERSYQREHRYSGERNNGFESHDFTKNRRSSTNLYSDERQNVGPISHQDTTHLQHRGNKYSQSGWSNHPSTSIGWPAAANHHKANFASRFHNQSFVGNGGCVNSVGQYDSHEENAFSGY